MIVLSRIVLPGGEIKKELANLQSLKLDLDGQSGANLDESMRSVTSQIGLLTVLFQRSACVDFVCSYVCYLFDSVRSGKSLDEQGFDDLLKDTTTQAGIHLQIVSWSFCCA